MKKFIHPRTTIQAGWVALLLALVLSPGTGRAQTSPVQYINGKAAFMSINCSSVSDLYPR